MAVSVVKGGKRSQLWSDICVRNDTRPAEAVVKRPTYIPHQSGALNTVQINTVVQLTLS